MKTNVVSQTSAGPAPIRASLAVALVAAAILLQGVLASREQAWSAILTAGMFGASIALGASVLAAVSLVSGARWWDPIRGVVVSVMRTLPIPIALIVLSVTIGLTALYPWARPGADDNHLIHEKAVWLNAPLFISRAILIAVAWFALVGKLGRAALHPKETRAGPGAVAAAFLVAFAATISVAYWDWTMSLEPEWFSTMYGVYGFAGSFLAGIAAVALLVARAESEGRLSLTTSQRHSLGKLLFAFSMFWAYIWYCQFFLIWYSDLPEESPHYAARMAGGWSGLFWVNPILNFVIPFVVLLSARAKQSPSVLMQAAIVVLMGRWLDTFLLVAPSAGPLTGFPIYAVAATVAVVIGMLYRYAGSTLHSR